MPAQKSKKPVQSAAKPATKVAAKPASRSTPAKAAATVATKTAIKKPVTKVKIVPASKSPAKAPLVELKKATPAAVVADVVIKKKPGRPPKAASAESGAAPKTGAKRGRKPKNATQNGMSLPVIDAVLAGEPEASGEKVKPLRMKISKAKERALMKEFGLDETVLSEEDIVKRRLRLKALIKLGKTRGYLTHGEISDHLPDKLVEIGRAHV